MGGCFSERPYDGERAFLNEHEVVLSYKYWQTHYGADASVVARTVNLDGDPLHHRWSDERVDDEAGFRNDWFRRC